MIKAAFSIFLNALYLLSIIVPKRRDLWLFSAWNGMSFSDNPKYLFLHVLKSRPKVNAFWLTKNRKLYAAMRCDGLPCVYAYSLKGFFLQIQASAVFFTHCVDWDFCSYLISPRTKRVQLWHGMPVKNIGYDDKLNAPRSFKAALIKCLLPFRSESFDFMIALGERDKAIYQSAFRVSADKIRITGFPRNDGLIIDQHETDKQFRNILYLPTFRGLPGSDFPLLRQGGFELDEVDQWLFERKCKLHVKLHPVNNLACSDFQKINRSKSILLMGNIDIYERLHAFDIFITDFSSVYFDCLLTGKQIILTSIGLEDYLKKDRSGFYFDQSDLAVNEICSTWQQVLSQIDLPVKTSDQCGESNRIRERFHQFLDASSSERVCFEVEQLFSDC